MSNRTKPGNSEFALRAFPGTGVFPDLFRIWLWKCLTVLGHLQTHGLLDTVKKHMDREFPAKYAHYVLLKLLDVIGSVVTTPQQVREICVPLPGPSEKFMGERINSTNDFAYCSRKSYGPGVPKKIEKMPSSRYRYEDLTS